MAKKRAYLEDGPDDTAGGGEPHASSDPNAPNPPEDPNNPHAQTAAGATDASGVAPSDPADPGAEGVGLGHGKDNEIEMATLNRKAKDTSPKPETPQDDQPNKKSSKFVDAEGRRVGRSSFDSIGNDPVYQKTTGKSADELGASAESTDPQAAQNESRDGVVTPHRLADPVSEKNTLDVPIKPKVGVRLDHFTTDEAERVDARERRIFDYNALARAEGRPQAVTKEEMDRIP